ncbi:hypothetical protein BH09BAC4_BH09BAC4_49330 [soil metagenome]
MRISTFPFLLWLLVLSISMPALATHQVGGQIEMRYIGDVQGHYQITVTQYIEDGTRGAATQTTSGMLGIFRKSDNRQMTTFLVSQTGSKQPVVYANEFCAAQRNLRFVVFTYQATIQLAPGSYNDQQGYYISYQTRNRNAGINNISNPDQTGFTFYLEFPALQQNGQYYTNSSPHFGTINGEYVCIGDPFKFPFGGTDPDGDELRYSMVTPLNQKGTNQNAVSPGPYPDVSWLSGFSASNPMPGSPTLNVNAKTGQLTVTATQLGLFVFAVNVEEYRGGVKIGEVRRDFQLLVVECPPQTTPEPTVQIMDRPKVTTTTICTGESTVLVATVNLDWNYQWRRDGTNIVGATNATLTVRDEGQYTLLVSQKAVCSKSGDSDTLTVKQISAKAKVSTLGHLCATTGFAILTAVGDTGLAYQWYRDNQALPGQTTDTLFTTEPGRYFAALTQKTVGCKASSDTTSLERSAAVQALIKSTSGQNRICPNDSLALNASGGEAYRWQKDGTKVGSNGSQYTTRTAGIFSVTATDSYGCDGTSPPLTITQLAPILVTLDSIPGVCGPDNPVYTLVGSPPGGEFAGDGVTENQFSPKSADIGDHKLTYTVKAAPECAGTVATRVAVVAPIPTIKLIDSLTTYKGNTFTLDPVYSGNPNQFQWTPATYLDNPSLGNPSIMSIDNDITYRLEVKNSTGCAAKDTIHITVYNGVWIPDAFSPNGDGLNDVWDLPGIEAFPDAEVTIFNRWGEVIYSSAKGYPNPFDGTLNGASLPVGVYAYTLRTTPTRPVRKGRLVLVR